MAQNKNGSINQFLQAKATNNNSSYYHSLRTFYNNEPYFDKVILSQTTKRVTPSLELKGELTNERNKLKLSLKESVNNYKRNLNNNRIKNNHIIHNSSNSFTNSNSSKREQRYNSQFRTEISPDRENQSYHKTENNIIRRARSGYYSNLQEDPSVKDNDKMIERNNNHKKRILNIMQSSPSQPLFNESKFNLRDNKKTSNSNDKNILSKKIDEKIYQEKTYNAHNNNSYHLFYNRSLDNKSMSRSINDINNDELDNKNKSIKNYKSNTVKRYNTLDGKIKHIFVNDLDENNSDIKENYKYHSITVKKAKINKEDLRIDLKRKYNIYTNRFDKVKLNENLLNYSTKTISPKKISIFNKNYFSNRRRFNGQKSGEITNKYILKKNENHTIFESINLSKRKQNVSEEKKNLYNNRKIIINDENKSLRGITGKSLDEIKHINSVESEKRIRGKFTSSSYKIESKNINNNKDKYISQYITKNRSNHKIVEKKALINNGINYIYEGRNMKQKSFVEVTRDLNNLLENEMSKSSDLTHSKINKNIEPINKNQNMHINKNRIKSYGNIQPKITKRSIERLKIKEITVISEANKIQKNDSYFKAEERKTANITKKENNNNNSNNNSKNKDLIIKKSNSISIVSKKQETKNKIKKISLKKIKANNINNEICKVSNFVFYGKQIKKDNDKSNIIIIINNTDKNNSKKTPIINNNQKNDDINHNNNNLVENNINLNSNKINESSSNNNISSNNKINNVNSKRKNNIVNINLKKINNIKISKLNIIKKNSLEINKNLKIKNDIIKDIKKDSKANNNLIKKINKNIINDNLNNDIKDDIKKDVHEKKNEIKEVKIELEINNKKNGKKKENNESKNEKNISNDNQIEKKENINNTINEKEEVNDIKDNSLVENNKNINININKNNISEIIINMNNKIDDNNEEGKRKIEAINNVKNNEANVNINLNEEINSPPIKSNCINDSQNISHAEEESKKIDFSLNSKIPSLIDNTGNSFKKNLNIDISKNKIDTKSEANLINRYNNFLTKKEMEDRDQSSNSSQEKKPDFNNNDCSIEEIQEIRPVIQHNIQRKRPVFTLPASKKRSISQGKPFNLIQKYYDENFILEDDAEEKFNQYIKIDGDSRNDSIDNSFNSSNSSITDSNKKSNYIKNNEKSSSDSNIDIERNDIKTRDNNYSKDNSDIKNCNNINNYSNKNSNLKFNNNKKNKDIHIDYENKENENYNITSNIINNN